ncbi:hypothetical protein M1403_04090 [Patescibacteria group bacterium]|nr:hypothetical protein [Patescibacteria group bacterium]
MLSRTEAESIGAVLTAGLNQEKFNRKDPSLDLSAKTVQGIYQLMLQAEWLENRSGSETLGRLFLPLPPMAYVKALLPSLMNSEAAKRLLGVSRLKVWEVPNRRLECGSTADPLAGAKSVSEGEMVLEFPTVSQTKRLGFRDFADRLDLYKTAYTLALLPQSAWRAVDSQESVVTLEDCALWLNGQGDIAMVSQVHHLLTFDTRRIEIYPGYFSLKDAKTGKMEKPDHSLCHN